MSALSSSSAFKAIMLISSLRSSLPGYGRTARRPFDFAIYSESKGLIQPRDHCHQDSPWTKEKNKMLLVKIPTRQPTNGTLVPLFTPYTHDGLSEQ